LLNGHNSHRSIVVNSTIIYVCPYGSQLSLELTAKITDDVNSGYYFTLNQKLTTMPLYHHMTDTATIFLGIFNNAMRQQYMKKLQLRSVSKMGTKTNQMHVKCARFLSFSVKDNKLNITTINAHRRQVNQCVSHKNRKK